MRRRGKGAASVTARVRAKKHSKKTLMLSFDEWNVWFHSNSQKRERWQTAAHHLEDVYTFEDALLVGCMLMTLQNNCDRVKMACLAQLVNVIAPILTEDGGRAWAQTIFYPFMLASNYGRGTTLRTITQSDSYTTTVGREVPYLATSVIHNEEKKELIIFAANRSLDESMTLEIDADGFESARLIEHVELYCDDLQTTNDRDHQRVAPASVNVPTDGPIILKKHSWNMLRFQY